MIRRPQKRSDARPDVLCHRAKVPAYAAQRRSGADDGPNPGGAQADAPVRCRGPGAAISHPRKCKLHTAARPRGPHDAEAPAEGAGTVAHTARSMGGEEHGRGGACHPSMSSRQGGGLLLASQVRGSSGNETEL